jgi:hypothetical protein
MKKLIRKTWVCGICSQGFTRMSSSRRHNSNLHCGFVLIVRPFDYLNARLSGSFPTPPDPLLFRRERTSRKSFGHEYSNDSSSWPSAHHNPGIFKYHNVQSPTAANGDNVGSFYCNSLHLHPQIKSGYNTRNVSAKPLEINSKLQELQSLLFKNYPSGNAREFYSATVQAINQGNVDCLDERLAYLRTLHKT